jgi:nonribosomal peptide synthetase DhbF
MNFIENIWNYKDSGRAAIVFGEEIHSYKSLIGNALRFACHLKNEHISRVIIKTGRSPSAVTAALGVMFSGGVFAFLAESTPQEYVNSAAADLETDCIIGDDVDFNAYPQAADDFKPELRDYNEPVCAVFTSGSTGSSKGALLTYRALCETVEWQTEYMKLPSCSHTGSYAEFSFIAAFWELWYPLANGFTLFLTDRKTRLDVRMLCGFIEQNYISYIFLPPDVAEIFTGVYEGGALRFLRVAGGRLRSCGEPRGYEILYSLGMSENAGSVTFNSIKTAISENIPIGKPFGKTEVYLIEGEMCLSGPSLFAGYAGRSELTAKCLVPNPNANGRALYAKMYMSGDLAERDNDGNLIYKGRQDWIVKINNVKTNPLEIERVILSNEHVREAAVLPFERSGGGAFLACFYVGGIETEPLAAFAKDRLLPTSLPSVFVKMQSLPKNSNGKTDHSKLLLPAQTANGDNSPLTGAEKTFAEAFERILGLPAGTVGAEDSFVHLGGNSLGMMRLQAKLMKTAGLSLRYSDIFSAQTPRKIALLKAADKRDFSAAKPLPGVPYPLTAPERQMWLLWRTNQDNGRYTVRIRCDFEGEIDRKKAESALAELTRKNPSLCSYYKQNGEVSARYFAENNIAFSECERKSFDLNKSPLFAATLNESSLIFTAHHIIADAAAMRVLMEDFWIIYGGGTPEPAEAFHALELLESKTDFTGSADEEFWAGELHGFHFDPLPEEITQPEEKAARESVIAFSADECEILKSIAAKAHVTLFILFTAAAAKLMSLISGSGTVCIGVPVSGRDLPQTIRTVGMLVRTLPLVTETNVDFSEIITRVNERFTGAFAHQHYPFERMNERFGARYDCMVNLIPLPRQLKNVCGLNPRIIRGGYPAPPAKLVIDLREEALGFSALFTYDSFKDETAANWVDAFRAILFGQTPNHIIIPQKSENHEKPEETALESGYSAEFSEIWTEILGVNPGNFYEAGGTSLKAIQIEEAMLLRGLYISAADILRLQDFSAIAGCITPAEDIDWEA